LTGNATTATSAGSVTTNANLTGEVTSVGNAATVTNAAVIGKVLTGYTAGAGTVAAADNILQAVQKLDGNDGLKANLASPTFTGVPAAPTAAALTNTTQVATTAFVTTADNLKANLASPTFTGVPAAPTATALTNTTQVATTAFVTTADNLKADLAGPTFTGVPAAPTAAALTSTTQLASTAFVTTADNLKADLASPTFTGTPTLPTGTIATTQTAGNNTTALATTAFVTTAEPTKVFALAINATATSSATPTEITGLSNVVAAGTYTFQYFIIYRSTVTTTGVRFAVNHTGTIGAIVYNTRWIDASATASTAAADQDMITATGGNVGGFASRARKTTAANGTTISVGAANSDMLMIIEGVMVVSASGNIQLWHGSENANSTQVMAGTSLILTKTL